MSDSDVFRQVKLRFGEMDDLCQERRRIYTQWASGKLPPAEFGQALRENLAATRRTADALEAALEGHAQDD